MVSTAPYGFHLATPERRGGDGHDAGGATRLPEPVDLSSSGDAELVQHVKRLQQDHGWLEEDWLELSPHLHAVAQGQGWYDVAILRSAVPVFSELYREHIALEETIVYPASRRHQLELRRRLTEIG